MTVKSNKAQRKCCSSIVSSITVYEALKLMGEKNVGTVLVIEDNVLKGTF
jgi:predicted transcriptional regulator